MDFQTMRIYGSIAIILGCFLFLYPKLLHPVFMSLLGLNTGTEGKKADDLIPPPLRDRHPGAGDLPEHIRKMRGPHPGMRAAAAEQSKQQTKGSGRGMMGVILPMYAVGIVVYLCYTLFKVFGKNDKSSEGRRSPAKEGAPRSGYSIGPEGDDQGRVATGKGDNTALSQDDLKRQLVGLQSLAQSVKGGDMKEMDMRKLQERLAETEAQMTRILAAMQAVQTKVDDVAIEKPTKTVHQENEEEAKLTTSDRSSESSPESESFEIVSKSDRDSGGEENRTRKVETLTSTTAEEQEKEEEEEVEAEDDKQGEVDGEDEEPTEEIIRDREDNGPEEDKTVRKRIPKTEHVES